MWWPPRTPSPQLIAAIRRAGRVVPGAAEPTGAVCTGHDYRSLGKPRVDWDDPAAKDTLVNDANALVSALKDGKLEEQAVFGVVVTTPRSEPGGEHGVAVGTSAVTADAELLAARYPGRGDRREGGHRPGVGLLVEDVQRYRQRRVVPAMPLASALSQMSSTSRRSTGVIVFSWVGLYGGVGQFPELPFAAMVVPSPDPDRLQISLAEGSRRDDTADS